MLAALIAPPEADVSVATALESEVVAVVVAESAVLACFDWQPANARPSSQTGTDKTEEKRVEKGIHSGRKEVVASGTRLERSNPPRNLTDTIRFLNSSQIFAKVLKGTRVL
ncbi:hypothetical protein GCM10027348_15630 [Hymenobacter tenuis]